MKLEDRDDRTSSTPAADPPGITTGVILEGKYLVGSVIGSGAVGIVFKAKNVELDENVAIKCLRPELLVDRATVARFAREAKAAAAIKSEYCATVHDVGTTSDGVPYIVMELLEGKDLGTVVAESGTIGPRTAVEYALQVCEALAVAHAKGIVHRDIKPENCFLAERAGGMRIVKVLDFGISKAALTGSIFKNELPAVKTMSLMGTPLYMSPEQVRITDSVDVRSDIWSLGMVIYEMLTGQTAFGGTSITEICASILEATPKPIELHRDDLPSGLVSVITKCLQKDANRRFQNIAELALALMPFGPKRTRLNVERAVAVLQGSGQLDKSVQLNSTVPPAPVSDYSLTPIPQSPRAPGMTPASPMIVPPPSSGDEPSSDLGMKRSMTKVIVALSVAFVGAAVIALVVGKSSVSVKDEPAKSLAAASPLEVRPAPVDISAPSASVSASSNLAAAPPSATTTEPTKSPTRVVYARPQLPKTASPTPLTPDAGIGAAKSDCNPPFYFEGTKKVFKPACL